MLASQQDDNLDVVNALLAKGANVNATNEEGATALLLAAGDGPWKTVELLIDKGADINVKDQEGSTALIIASEKGHLDTVGKFSLTRRRMSMPATIMA